ncbi:hypothetical protein [Hyphomicrobium sp.]|uniref:hypothetical protein n=1 Tax=Hyphomicrobium sp. TaxID=82 RepID=UPI002E3421D8|nr:hypothetical protein [Hyphomicrobium sp.]HEX2842275.1 hypothetical protein [Hyphomicrobium sp.]
MAVDAGREMKAKLRGDMRAAMKDGRSVEVEVIRTLVTAIDNAEAPPIDAVNSSVKVEPLVLSSPQVRLVIMEEVHERERAAAELERLEKADRAEALRAEARLAKRYVE